MQLQVHLSNVGYGKDDLSLLSIATEVMPVDSVGLSPFSSSEVIEKAATEVGDLGFEFCLTRGLFSTVPDIKSYGQISRRFATGGLCHRQIESELLIQWTTFINNLSETCGPNKEVSLISAADKILYIPKVRGVVRFHAAKQDCTEVIYPFETLAGLNLKSYWNQRKYGRYQINGKSLYFGPSFNKAISVNGFKKQIEYLNELENPKTIWDLDLGIFKDPRKIEKLVAIAPEAMKARS